MREPQRPVEILAIAGAIWLSGKIVAHSLVTVPALLLAQSEDGLSEGATLKVWRRMHQRGHAHSPKIVLITSSAFAYLAWCASRTTGSRVPTFLFGTAASLVTGVVPFTILFMRPTNMALMARASEEDRSSASSGRKSEEKSNEGLFTRWATLTGVRGLLPLAAGILGLVGVLEH